MHNYSARNWSSDEPAISPPGPSRDELAFDAAHDLLARHLTACNNDAEALRDLLAQLVEHAPARMIRDLIETASEYDRNRSTAGADMVLAWAGAQ